jgi:hypothetical protein
MKKLEHGMLLDAKQVEDLGLGEYLFDAFNAKESLDLIDILHRLTNDLAECDVSENYEEKKSTCLEQAETFKLCKNCKFYHCDVGNAKHYCDNPKVSEISPITGRLMLNSDCLKVRAKPEYKNGQCFEQKDNEGEKQ